jgi:hypothetical protein
MQVDELLKPFPIKEFHPFPRAMLGPGSHEMIGPEALKLGFRKSLIMTSGLRGSDIIHKISESMKYHGLEVVIYDQVESNPKDYNVMDAVALYQQNNCDSFVSIGGGSSHDACKGARISVAHDGRNVNDFEGFNKSENPKNPPHIAVSTTAGTRAPAKSSRDLVGDQRAEWVAGVVAEGCGDVGDAGQAQCGDREVPQRRHDLWGMSGAGGGAVLVEGHIADPVQAVLDRPMASDPAREQARVGIGAGQAGDRIDRLGLPLPAGT